MTLASSRASRRAVLRGVGGKWHQPFLAALAQHSHDHAAAVDLSGGQVQVASLIRIPVA